MTDTRFAQACSALDGVEARALSFGGQPVRMYETDLNRNGRNLERLGNGGAVAAAQKAQDTPVCVDRRTDVALVQGMPAAHTEPRGQPRPGHRALRVETVVRMLSISRRK
jgi:hypothetical protein